MSTPKFSVIHAPSEECTTPSEHGTGRRLPINASRRLVLDVIHYSRRAPCYPVDILIDVKSLAEQRKTTDPRISWSVLFCKAYALVAAEIPQLRQCYLRWPRPHLFEHPASVATIAISRRYRGQDWLFWGRLRRPESQPLAALQRQLLRYQNGPVEDVFARQLLMSRFPTPLRRIIWWARMNLSPHKRARRLGTFGHSVLASKRVFNRNHPHFLTSSLSYGLPDPSGNMLVTLIGDHRVMDGITAARALNNLQDTLRGPILNELSGLTARPQGFMRRLAA
jgi:hypothetical protein